MVLSFNLEYFLKGIICIMNCMIDNNKHYKFGFLSLGYCWDGKVREDKESAHKGLLLPSLFKLGARLQRERKRNHPEIYSQGYAD